MTKPEPKRNPAIAYINPEVPDVTARAPQGRRITRRVPDTLDIAERARLAARAMADLTHPDYDYEFFFCSDMDHNPPYMRVTVDAINCQYKYQEAMPLVRSISGYDGQLEVDQRWMETTLQRIGPDGMAYWPQEGRAFSGLPEVPDAGWMQPCYGDAASGQLCQPCFMARIISAMTLYYRQDRNPVWLRTIRNMIARLRELSGFEGDEAWILPGGVAPGAKLTPDIKRPEWMYISHQGWMAQAIAQYAREHDDEEALAYACQLINYIIGPHGMFDEQGAMTEFNHFHHHSQSIIALADLALITGNERYREMAWKTYTWARSRGDAIVGFFPEGIRDDQGNYEYSGHHEETAETCEVADMIAAACKLSELGYDTYDDIERWTRNQLAENQMTHSQWIHDRIQALKLPFDPKTAPYEWSDRVAERHVGAFAGWPLPNDFIWFSSESNGHHHLEWSFQHCCTGNGSRVLYYIWDHITREVSDHTLRVNLLMNYSDALCDIDSYIPYTGRVDVLVKQDRDLEVHLPEWAEDGKVICRLFSPDAAADDPGQTLQPTVGSGFLHLGRIPAGHSVRLEFPLEEKELHDVRIGHMTFDLIVKGWEVVKQSPEGKWCPFYQREHYRSGHPRQVERERFIPESPIRGW